MSTTIGTLKDSNNNDFLPVTDMSLVNGLSEELGNIESVLDTILGDSTTYLTQMKYGVVSQTLTWTGSDASGYNYTITNPIYGIIPQANIDLFNTCGATFNDTDSDILVTDWFGREFTHKAGYFCLNGLGDLSYNEIKNIYEFAHIKQPYGTSQEQSSSALFEATSSRTNMWTLRANWNTTYSFYGLGRYNSGTNLTSLRLNYYNGPIYAGAMRQFLLQSKKVKYVYPAINCSSITKTDSSANSFYDAFNTVSSLEEIRLAALKVSVSIAKSSLLSTASVLYMINNEASTSAITITLHATVYARVIADTDIQTALSNHPNVTLAST